MADFVKEHADAGFVHLVCYPYDEHNPHCNYTGSHPPAWRAASKGAAARGMVVADYAGVCHHGIMASAAVGDRRTMGGVVPLSWPCALMVPGGRALFHVKTRDANERSVFTQVFARHQQQFTQQMLLRVPSIHIFTYQGHYL